ncbi:MAG TPA: hypothetical protein PKB10_10400, partial [Tepidisphaeraceae bacterium]|nr:hypothetical protein [Tepidisphaeraceae bacterium]
MRLHRGRKLLADAMSSRGFQLSTVVVATLLPTIVQEQVFAGLIASSSHAAAQIAAGSVLPSGISPELFNLAVTASHGFAFGKLKGIALITLLLGGTWTGGTTLGARLVPALERLSLPSLVDWVAPLLRSITTPRFPLDLRVDALPSGKDDPLYDLDLARERGTSVAWMNLDDPAPLRSAESIVTRSVHALAGGEVHRIPLSAGSIDLVPAPAQLQADAVVIAPKSTLPTPVAQPADTIDRSVPSGTRPVQVAGAVRQTGGVRSFDRLRIDGADRRARYHLAGGSLRARELTIGDRGFGEFRQTGGSVRIAGRTTLGRHAHSHGQYDLQAGALETQTLVVGDAGTGLFIQSAGVTQVDEKLILGEQAEGVGRLDMRGGILSASEIDVAA